MNQRLDALDIFRGLTVASMILVNNGVGHEQFHQLQHSVWNGLTFCDLVFPFFLFMVGVSVFLSLGKEGIVPTWQIGRRIMKRTVLLFFIGVLLHAWDAWIGGKANILSNLRVWGVLERIALCYLLSSLTVLFVPVRRLWIIILSLLASYSAILLLGNGFAQDESNIACIVDRTLFGEAHLYHKSPIDPEGLLGTISALAHTLIGVVAGWIIKQKNTIGNRISTIMLLAVLIGVAGIALQFILPLNKRVWSPSYVLVTCALASAILSLLVWAVDMKGHKRYYSIFRMFGVNAFFIYVLSELLSPLFSTLGIPEAAYNLLLSLLHSPQWSSVCYALLFDLLMAFVAWIMCRRQWFVKI